MAGFARRENRSIFQNTPQYVIPSPADYTRCHTSEMDDAVNMAIPDFCQAMDRQSKVETDTDSVPDLQKENLCGQFKSWHEYDSDPNEHEESISRRNTKRHYCQHRSLSQRASLGSTTTVDRAECQSCRSQILLRGDDVTSGKVSVRSRSQTRDVRPRNETVNPLLERADPVAKRSRGAKVHSQSSVVTVATFNCQGWDSQTIVDMLGSLSCQHSKDIILCCQETWRYELPSNFLSQVSSKYNVTHTSAMDPAIPRSRGRPFGGVCLIISKSISYKQHYSNSRCTSIILEEFSLLLNNVYMPFSDSRITHEQNVEKYMEAMSCLTASHDLADGVSNFITVGDVNCAPMDVNDRARLLSEFIDSYSYEDGDLRFYPSGEYTHESGRILDRIITSRDIFVNNVFVDKSYFKSDHFPVIANITLTKVCDINFINLAPQKRRLNWKKASEKAIEAYSRLSNRRCKISFEKFRRGEINGPQLHTETIKNLQESAEICIPKFRSNITRRHNIPQWRERMATFRQNVDFWLQTQFLQGGPTVCTPFVRQQIRLARAQYKRQHRLLRREIQSNIADHVTKLNCFNVLFNKKRKAIPAVINGHTRDKQPEMWRNYFKHVFKAAESPYSGNLLDVINDKLDCNNTFLHYNINEINNAIVDINTNKSYNRHFHWKKLIPTNHFAKLCLRDVFNCWANDVMNNVCDHTWHLFDTDLSPTPKNGKKDLSLLKSWRPISIGTSENWILEKIFLRRLAPFLETGDCQFGYKRGHSTAHAIELVRILERSSGCHVCMLDASSAFDTLSWCRIRDQLLKRKVPLYLVKLCMKQLISNRIIVCGTCFLYPRSGIKQGGILSGQYFAICYDDLINELRITGAGFLFNLLNNNRILIQIIVYADDIVLIARSPFGLAKLIEVTMSFAKRYNDLNFNHSKSCILLLGTSSLPPVSVHGIPVAESYTYLGVTVGRKSNPQQAAAATLYTRTHIMLQQNKELFKCSNSVKKIAITTYGSVYSVENLLSVDSCLRQAHRYLTRAVHKDWRQYADLPGPNIRSRRLYTVYGVDSLEVIHRKRRNNFLIRAESSPNKIISGVLGSLPRITI